MATAIAIHRTHPSLPRIYFNEARFELLKLSRNRSYLFSMIGFPGYFLSSVRGYQQEFCLSRPYYCPLPSRGVFVFWRHGFFPIRHRRRPGV